MKEWSKNDFQCETSPDQLLLYMQTDLDQAKLWGGLSDFLSVKSLKLHMTYCLRRFLDQNRKREDKIRILDTEKVSWNTTSNLPLDLDFFGDLNSSFDSLESSNVSDMIPFHEEDPFELVF